MNDKGNRTDLDGSFSNRFMPVHFWSSLTSNLDQFKLIWGGSKVHLWTCIYRVCSIAGFTIYFIRLVKSNNTNKINQIILKSLLHVSDSFDPFEFELLVFPCVFRFTINEYENSNAVWETISNPWIIDRIRSRLRSHIQP